MGQPKFITDPSYDALHAAAVTMVREARTHGVIDAVLAPVRGGLMFGVVASHTLNVPVIPVAYSSKKGAGDDKNHLNQLPILPSTTKTILIVDDIVDSGHTLKEIVEHYQSIANLKVITAVFHYKVGAVFVPDLYFWLIPADSEFINYPYEVA
jgi:hypoxanthine phosphoribosyltransferase